MIFKHSNIALAVLTRKTQFSTRICHDKLLAAFNLLKVL